MPFFLLFAAFALLAITIAVANARIENRRRAGLAALAQSLGLRFAPGTDPGHDDRYAQFDVFRRGHSRVATNTLHGTMPLFERPCQVRAGDFRYRERRSDGKGSRTCRFSYLLVHLPWTTPWLHIRPEGVLDKLKGALGFDDIDFESEQFSSKYHVQSGDKRFAYDVLHPRMMELLLAGNPLPIRIADGVLCLGDGSRRWEPAEFRRHLAFVVDFCQLWPRHLLLDLDT